MVPVKEFGEHVQCMHADRDKLFEQEYTVSLVIMLGTHRAISFKGCANTAFHVLMTLTPTKPIIVLTHPVVSDFWVFCVSGHREVSPVRVHRGSDSKEQSSKSLCKHLPM